MKLIKFKEKKKYNYKRRVFIKDLVLKIFVGSDGEHVAFSGGNATFAGDVKIPRYLYHDGDTNTYLEFSAADNLKLYAGGKIYFHAHDNGSLYLSR